MTFIERVINIWRHMTSFQLLTMAKPAAVKAMIRLNHDRIFENVNNDCKSFDTFSNFNNFKTEVL